MVERKKYTAQEYISMGSVEGSGQTADGMVTGSLLRTSKQYQVLRKMHLVSCSTVAARLPVAGHCCGMLGIQGPGPP